MNPGKDHWNVVKWILRFLWGTSCIVICYISTNLQVKGFVYSNFDGDIDGQKSTTGYTFTLIGGAINWTSKLQVVVALSTTKIQYLVQLSLVKREYVFSICYILCMCVWRGGVLVSIVFDDPCF